MNQEREIVMKSLRRKWRLFTTSRRGFYSLFIMVVLLFFSLTAEFWANDRPHILFYKDQIYFPIIKNYHPTTLGLPSQTVTVDYKNLHLEEKDWALWPLIPWSPLEINAQVEDYPSSPSKNNWMGTDNRGRDILSRIIYGFRYSIGFSVLVWLGSFIMGSILGSIMGFLGGRVDLFGQRVVEIFQSIPDILVLITVISVLGAHLGILVIYSITFGWMNISLYMRAEFLKIRQMDFIQLAKSYGAPRFKIMFRHIFPNALTPIVTFSPFKLANGIYSLAVLDYLGFGLPPPTPSWGELLLQAEQHFTTAWWLAFFPSLFLFLVLISLNFIGEGIRKAFDPKALISS